jgi:hypothetical protein
MLVQNKYYMSQALLQYIKYIQCKRAKRLVQALAATKNATTRQQSLQREQQFFVPLLIRIALV